MYTEKTTKADKLQEKEVIRFEKIERDDPNRQAKLLQQREDFSIQADSGKLICPSEWGGKMGKINCLKCKFYLTKETNHVNNILDKNGVPHETRGISTVGICRRFPTHVNREPNDWCGEFQPIKEAKI